MVLQLQPAGGGWYAVTSPLDPAINTQAKSIEDAFVMALDAQKCLKAGRAKLARQLKKSALTEPSSARGTRLAPKTKTRATKRAEAITSHVEE
jgi:hypothetical protein